MVVTGGNSGIGFATASELARRGADVILATRDPDRGRAAADRIRDEIGGTARSETLDLASFSSIRSFADRLLGHGGGPDVLINNAGVFIGSERFAADGFEWTMQVNHLGPFLLTCLLASHPGTKPERIITVASEMQKRTRRDPGFERLTMPGRYRATETYARSKLANVLFTRELAARLAGTGAAAFAAHPGMVATRIAQDGDSRLGALVWKVAARRMRTPEEGAATPVYLATEPEIEHLSGGYFADRRLIDPGMAGSDDRAAARLWNLSAAATGCDAGHPTPADGGTVRPR